MKLILASSGRNRQNLFKMIGLKYEVVKSLCEEESSATNPSDYVIDLSKDKANSASLQINEKAIIVAADSVMYMGDKIFEKPKDKREAFENMKLMSGNIVYSVTGITVKDLYQDKEVSIADIAEVHFNKISDEDISWYVENDDNILNCCGFSLEGKAALFIDKIVGDYNTVRGISVNKMYSLLQKLGYSISDFEIDN